MTLRKFYGPFRVKRIPIYYHWSAVLMSAVFLLATPLFGLPLLFIVIGLFVLSLVHELGHAFLAVRLGYGVKRIDIFPVHGLCYYDSPYSAYEDAIIAWGGVVGQLILFIPAVSFLGLFGNTASGCVNVLLVTFTYVNACSIALNLAPARGLDGAKSWRIVPIVVKARWSMYQLRRKKFLR